MHKGELRNWCFWTVEVEKTLESPLDCREIQPVNSKEDQPWVFFGRSDAKAETPVLWPPHAKSWLIGKDWCWEGLGAGGEGDDRGWNGWMASLTRWMWVRVNSRILLWTGRPGVLRFTGSQSVRHDRATELNWSFIYSSILFTLLYSSIFLMLYMSQVGGPHCPRIHWLWFEDYSHSILYISQLWLLILSRERIIHLQIQALTSRSGRNCKCSINTVDE